MANEEFKNEVVKIMKGKSQVTQIDWLKTRSGEYHIRISYKASARQAAKLKPLIRTHYQQELA